MKIKVSNNIFQTIPGLTYTVLVFEQINNTRKASNVTQLLRGSCAVVKNDLKKPAKKAFFELMDNLELNPGTTLLETYLLSSKIKKILNKQEIEASTNLENLVNYLSLKHFIPFHAVDLDRLDGDYVIDLYEPKKGKKAPDLELDSQTRLLAIWFPEVERLEEDKIDQVIKDVEFSMSKYTFATLREVYHLNSENNELDLEYISALEQAANEQKASQEEVAEVKKAADVTSVNLTLLNQKFDLQEKLRELMVATLQRTGRMEYPEEIGEILDPAGLIEIERPKDLKHGDYSCNLAMKLTKMLSKSPMEIAQRLLNNMPQSPFLEGAEIAAPGFINFRVSLGFQRELLRDILLADSFYGKSEIGKGKKALVEYGCLNYAKPFGVHHFLTSILGQTTVNLMKAIGYEVVAADYPGDWGTQFGKVIYAYKTWGDQAVVEADPIRELLALYVRFHEEAAKDATLEDFARAENAKLEQGDEENRKLWQWICDLSKIETAKIYQTLGVKHDISRGESSYVDEAKTALEQWKAERKIVEGEKGAWVVKFANEELPDYLVRKSDGTTIYATRDIVQLIVRAGQFPNLDKMIYVVDSSQSLHFKQLFATAKAWGIAPATQLIHLAFGRMGFPDGGMSTRRGKILWASDIINEALERALILVQEKSSELPESEQKRIAQGMAVGAIKHGMLTQAPETDFNFEWDKVMTFDGNSAPYLQYTLARAQSILRKANSVVEDDGSDQTSLFSIQSDLKAQEEANLAPFSTHYERDLLKMLLKYPEKTAHAAANLKPNILTLYLYELAQTFNTFYHSVQVLKTGNKELLQSRLELVKALQITLKNGLTLLDIATFERM